MSALGGFICAIGQNPVARAGVLRLWGVEEDRGLKFLRLLGQDAVHAAYKVAAKQHHPDHGGDAETMQQLNRAWAEVKGEL
jgi:hypothetical protein